MLSSEAGPDNIANYARITPIADGVSILYRNGKFSINPDYFSSPSTGYVHLSGDSMSGYLSLVGAPVLDLHATPKFWVLSALNSLSGGITNYINNPAIGGGFIHLSGDKMSGGYLSLANEPTLSAHAVNLGYLQNKYIEDPTIKANNQVLKYSTTQNAWIAGTVSNDVIDTNVRTVTADSTLAQSDNNNIVMFNKTGGTITCYLPDDTVGHKIGSQIIVIQKGTAQVVFTGAYGVLIRSSGSRLKTIEQWSGAVVIKIAANEWFVGGDVTV
jgi:hypothetical protein